MTKNILIIIAGMLWLNCSNPASNNNDNTWYLGLVGADYVAPNKSDTIMVFDSFPTIQDVWVESGSNAAYAIISRYNYASDSLEGVLYDGADSICIPMYRMVLDGRIFYASKRYGPGIRFSPDSETIPLHGKPILLMNKNGYCADGAENIAYIFKVNPMVADFRFRISDDFLRWAP